MKLFKPYYQLVIGVMLVFTTKLAAHQHQNIDSISIKGITTSIELNNPKAELDSVTINIYNLNTKVKTICSHDGTFNFSLPLHSYMIVEFVKENYVPKRIIFNTSYKGILKNVKPFDLEIVLINEKNGIDFSELDFPITLVEYDEKIKDFMFNDNYTEQMLSIQSNILKELE